MRYALFSHIKVNTSDFAYINFRTWPLRFVACCAYLSLQAYSNSGAMFEVNIKTLDGDSKSFQIDDEVLLTFFDALNFLGPHSFCL